MHCNPIFWKSKFLIETVCQVNYQKVALLWGRFSATTQTFEIKSMGPMLWKLLSKQFILFINNILQVVFKLISIKNVFHRVSYEKLTDNNVDTYLILSCWPPSGRCVWNLSVHTLVKLSIEFIQVLFLNLWDVTFTWNILLIYYKHMIIS